MRSKLAYGGEWVKVCNFRNKYFHAAAPCAMCRALTAGVVWYNFKTHEVRCMKCFTPPMAETPAERKQRLAGRREDRAWDRWRNDE